MSVSLLEQRAGGESTHQHAREGVGVVDIALGHGIEIIDLTQSDALDQRRDQRVDFVALVGTRELQAARHRQEVFEQAVRAPGKRQVDQPRQRTAAQQGQQPV
jgi:hypothetical protein